MTHLFTATLLLLIGCVIPAGASGSPLRPLVVILLPGTSLSDWQRADAPTLHEMLATGSVAVMNTRSARLPNDHRRETPESAALTLGAGSRAAGGSEITDFHLASGRVPRLALTYGSLYARRVAAAPPVISEVNVQWPWVQQEDSGQGYDLRPGNLGDGLVLHHIEVRVGGGRFAPPVACDSAGVVEVVAGGRLPRRLPNFLIWDAGPNIAAAEPLIRQAASEVSAERGQLIILSPFAEDRAYQRGERLTPIVLWGPSVPAGLLFSPSTRRAGLITNTDFAPSVAAFFGARDAYRWLPTAALGRPWVSERTTDAVADVTRVESTSYRQWAATRMLPWVALGLGLIMLGAISCSRRGPSCPPFLWLSGVVTLALLISVSVTSAALWFAGLSLMFLYLQRRLGVRRSLLLLASSNILVLLGDTVVGNPLMRDGLLGYSAVEGARYYGIGNEAMGVLIGSALVAANAAWGRDRPRKFFVGASLLGIALVLGLPAAGAKVGGLLVAVPAFGVFLWIARARRLSGRVVVCILLAMFLLLGAVAVLDWHHGAHTQSHLGAAIGRIAVGGWGEGLDIVERKLSVESHLLYHSAWAVPLWSCLLGLFLQWKDIRREECRTTKPLVYGGLTAVLVCLAVNDAGVVAAALCGSLVLCGVASLQTKQSLH